MPTIIESGTPQELADQIGQRVRRLPAGRYRVIVQPELDQADIAAEMHAIWQRADTIKAAKTSGTTDDEVMQWVCDVIDEERTKRRIASE